MLIHVYLSYEYVLIVLCVREPMASLNVNVVVARTRPSSISLRVATSLGTFDNCINSEQSVPKKRRSLGYCDSPPVVCGDSWRILFSLIIVPRDELSVNG